jgi:hypothetical protein
LGNTDWIGNFFIELLYFANPSIIFSIRRSVCRLSVITEIADFISDSHLHFAAIFQGIPQGSDHNGLIAVLRATRSDPLFNIQNMRTEQYADSRIVALTFSCIFPEDKLAKHLLKAISKRI